MLRSLVGSEMCIRDRSSPSEKHRASLDAAKLKIRTEIELDEWSRRGYAKSLRLEAFMDQGKRLDSWPRVDSSKVSVEEFHERHILPQTPAVVTGLTDGWDAATEWVPDRLEERFRGVAFRVGSDDDGDAVEVTMDAYWWYVDHGGARDDDNPVYLFDREFEEKDRGKSLMSDYAVPEYFKDDLFGMIGDKERPPWRWVVMGPARSGSGVHTDPLCTTAWNALLHGHKFWVLFPPETPKEPLKPELEDVHHVGGAAAWFSHVYPQTQAPEWKHPAPIVILQSPGETMYVPAGWWHAVLNLDTTIAVTHNLAEPVNFDKIWMVCARKRTDMVPEWMGTLRAHRPELAERAEELGGLAAVLQMAIDHRKKKCRSGLRLEDWTRRGYASRLDLEAIANAPERLGGCTRFWLPGDGRAACSWMAEGRGQPMVLEGGVDEWPAKHWSLQNLKQRFGSCKVRVGSDDNDSSVRMPLCDFAAYCSSAAAEADDNPLQVYDGAFEDHKKLKALLRDYEVPECFREDLFSVISDDERPPSRWIVLGPKRAGSSVTTDPLGTCSWHTLLQGRRRWYLAPPGTQAHLLSPSHKLTDPDYVGGAAQWFDAVWPNSQLPAWPCKNAIEMVQHPGQTVFVPAGWYQVVINLDFCIGITQNARRDDMVDEWMAGMEEEFPEIHKVAILKQRKKQERIEKREHRRSLAERGPQA
eukprot:TRINITY_DN15191_c0_g1_i1.p1 TRINITY_DN15191_c0_g1~~TRINITY_DN15191_c0_g1_i1.p1  ORF type:complete len:747 (+),score=168.71 TRINITY_DN15191_c0_g1_i1:148-2241(+)